MANILYSSFASADTDIYKTKEALAATGDAQTVFSLTYVDALNVDIYANGLFLDDSEYALTTNDTVTLTTGILTGEIVILAETRINR